MSAISDAAIADTQAGMSPCCFAVSGLVAPKTGNLNLEGTFAGGAWTFPSAGRLVGISRSTLGSPITAGTFTLSILVNGASQGTQVYTSGSEDYVTLSPSVSMSAGQTLSFSYETNGTFAGASTFVCYPFIVIDV